MKKIVLYLIFITFFLGLDFILWNFYIKTEQGKNIIKNSESQEKAEFIENLFLENYSKISLKKEEFLKGFWYLWVGLNGDEEVRFFDPKLLAESGLNFKEIKKLFNKALEFEIIKKDYIKVFIKPEDLPEGLAFNNKIYSSNISEYDDIKRSLEDKKNKSASEWKNLSEIYNIEGFFDKKNNADNQACKLDQKYCLKNNINIFGIVTDQLGGEISEVNIKILSKKDEIVKTDKNGIFSFNIEIFELENLKFQFEKWGFTSSIHSLKKFSKNKKKYNLGNIILSNKSVQISEVNLKDKKVNSGNARIEGQNILIETDISKYIVPLDSFWDGDKKFSGVVKIVTFEFNSQNSVPDSFLNIDTFGDGISNGLMGTYMITFGMPYMEVFDESGKRLFIKNSNPATLETKIENYDNIIKSVGKEKIILMLRKSSEDGVSITLKYLLDNFITHPPFWILDQKRGVWDNVPMALLDYDGNIKTIYYTSKY